MRQDRAARQQVEMRIEVDLVRETREQGPRELDLAPCLIDVRLDRQIRVTARDLPQAREQGVLAGDGEPRRQDVLQERAGGVEGPDVRDAGFGVAERRRDRLVAVVGRRLPVHVALAHEGALALREAERGEDLGRVRVQRAVVRRRCDPLAQEAVDAPRVDPSRVRRVPEPRFVGECYLREPVEDLHALA